MKAAVYRMYGGPDVVRIEEVEKPATGAGDVLIRVRATTISAVDWRARSLKMPRGFGFLGRLIFGVFGPRKKILGTELSGVIEAVGDGVNSFEVGDEVIAFSGSKFGGHAEYMVMPQDRPMVLKPAENSFEAAAALCFGGTTALNFLRDKGALQPGETVLVNGATGTVGSAVVQLARYFGAHVTAVCSGRNAELARSIGAEQVIDYTSEDFTCNGEAYDMIVDTAATVPWSRAKGSLNGTGRLMVVLGGLDATLLAPFQSRKNGKRVIAGVSSERVEDLQFLADLAAVGDFSPVIDSSFPLEQIVQAHARVDTGHKTGSVVVVVSE